MNRTLSRVSRPAPTAAAIAALGVVAGSVVAPTPAIAHSAPSTMNISTVVVPVNRAVGLYDVAHREVILATMPRETSSVLVANRKKIYTGRTVKLTGKVTYGANATLVRGQTVTLQLRDGASWKAVTTKTLSPDGTVTFAVKPNRTTTYRLAYNGSSPLVASVSSGQTITVTAPPPPPPVTSTTSSSGSSGGWSTASATGTGADIVAAAAVHIGKPYSYGAAGPDAFDCSGLTQYVFRQFGVSLPHNAHAQLSYGRAVSKADARPGDLVFFLSGGHAYHVGIYAGNGYMIDAPNSGSVVSKRQIWTSSVTFRRVI